MPSASLLTALMRSVRSAVIARVLRLGEAEDFLNEPREVLRSVVKQVRRIGATGEADREAESGL